MPFRNMSTNEIRSLVRHQIETLERWLRRLVDDVLRDQFGGSLKALPIKAETKRQVSERRVGDAQRYTREVDALLFDDLVTIICHPQLYGPHFQEGLEAPLSRSLSRPQVPRSDLTSEQERRHLDLCNRTI